MVDSIIQGANDYQSRATLPHRKHYLADPKIALNNHILGAALSVLNVGRPNLETSCGVSPEPHLLVAMRETSCSQAKFIAFV